jgi:hypothetical protein
MSPLPRAPSPPTALNPEEDTHSQDALHHHHAPCPLSEEEYLQSHAREGHHFTEDPERKLRDGSRTAYRPPYVRETTDRGTKRGLMPSPKHSRDALFYPDRYKSDPGHGLQIGKS